MGERSKHAFAALLRFGNPDIDIAALRLHDTMKDEVDTALERAERAEAALREIEREMEIQRPDGLTDPERVAWRLARAALHPEQEARRLDDDPPGAFGPGRIWNPNVFPE